MDKLWALAISILPWFMSATLAFCLWVTSELHAAKYSRFSAADARLLKAEIKQEVKESMSERLDTLLNEVNLLRTQVRGLSTQQAQLLTEVKLLREKS